MKSVHIRGFPGPYFSAFGLNTERYGVEKLRLRTLDHAGFEKSLSFSLSLCVCVCVCLCVCVCVCVCACVCVGEGGGEHTAVIAQQSVHERTIFVVKVIE